MTTHAEATMSHDHTQHDHSEAVASNDGLKFEKSELHEFVESDRSAGEHVGILLAVIFCISLVLFVSVTSWMMYNESSGHDPHHFVGADEDHH